MSESLYIVGYEPPVGQTVLDICDHIACQLEVCSENIQPDGSCFDQPTGTINLYQFGGEPIPTQEKVIEELNRLGLDVGETAQDTSHAFNCPVWRFPVLSNPASSITVPPDFNLASDNSALLRKVLRLDNAHGFGESVEIPLQTISERLSEVGSAQMAAHQRPAKWDSHSFNAGVDFDRIQRYLDRLESLVEWALARGFTTAYFA